MAMPPSRAVGRLCQRSWFGWAIQPFCRAIRRTAGVNAAQSAKAMTGIERFMAIYGNKTARICVRRRAPSLRIWILAVSFK